MSTHHVIIGGGPAATNALETLRRFDPESEITLICDEPAHSRMALPYWLADQIPREHTYTADEAYFQRLQIDARIGSRVNSIDPNKKTLALADGESISFDKLLIATGSRPLGLPIPGADAAGVQPLWTLADTEAALAASQGKTRPRVLMIGSGFIGFIMLNAMYKRGWQLAVVEREAHILPRMLNAQAASIVTDWLNAKGVALHTGTTVQSIDSASDGSKRVTLANGEQLNADLVVVATGVQANLDCVQGSGIDIDAGILVNERLQTNISDIYAAGDIAQGPVLFGNENAVHAVQPTAVEHGRIAAANMAGRDAPYQGSLLMNVLDVCGLQCASFGNWSDTSAEAMTISNPAGRIYRNLLWTGDQLSGAMFIGHANDLGMLTDVGMVKGIMQTQTALGEWKNYLRANPFDIRRPYVAAQVAAKLSQTTLLGEPTRNRGYRFKNIPPPAAAGNAHAQFVAPLGA